MATRSRPASFAVIALWLATALFPAGPVRAQCTTMDIFTTFCYHTMGAMTKRACIKVLKNMTYTTTQPTYRGCMPTGSVPTSMTSNVTYCNYIMAGRRLLVRRPDTGATMAHCQVTCDCGVLRIDVSDGLPVELMGFGVDGDDDDDKGAEAAGGRETGPDKR